MITFEFGLDWGVFAAKACPIMGPLLGMEVVTAFFVEAGFLGILLYGDGRVRPGPGSSCSSRRAMSWSASPTPTRNRTATAASTFVP